MNDFATLPVTPVMDAQNNPLTISFDFPGPTAYARIWKVQVGRVPLYLLDTNVLQNSEDDRRITGSLTVEIVELRLKQEIVLGIGGMRALAALGIRSTVCHMNEGHSYNPALRWFLCGLKGFACEMRAEDRSRKNVRQEICDSSLGPPVLIAGGA